MNVARPNEPILAHAENVLLSARSCQGLGLCDVLRKLFGDDEGRTCYCTHGTDIERYPLEVLEKIVTFH